MSRSKRRAAEAQTVIELLASSYPQMFAIWECRRRPLAMGIRADLQIALAGAVESTELAGALRFYTANAGHLRSMLAGGFDGRPCGAATKTEEVNAKARLAAIAERAARRKESMAAATKAAERKAEVPPFSSFVVKPDSGI
jgi:sRNA-binding protein